MCEKAIDSGRNEFAGRGDLVGEASKGIELTNQQGRVLNISFNRSALFMQTMLALYVNPDSAREMHENFVAANLKPQLEIFEELISAGIVERFPPGYRLVRVCGYDALRLYVDHLARVPLPRHRWVMP